jgi:hypothetical protein
MVDGIMDGAALKKHIKESKLKFSDAILDYYRRLGEKQGFTCLLNTSVVVNAVDYGRIELAWVEPSTVFTLEFGLPEDLYKHLFKVMVLKPAKAVIVLSSKSRCSPQKVKEMVERTPQLKGTEFVIVDVA